MTINIVKSTFPILITLKLITGKKKNWFFWGFKLYMSWLYQAWRLLILWGSHSSLKILLLFWYFSVDICSMWNLKSFSLDLNPLPFFSPPLPSFPLPPKKKKNNTIESEKNNKEKKILYILFSVRIQIHIHDTRILNRKHNIYRMTWAQNQVIDKSRISLISPLKLKVEV